MRTKTHLGCTGIALRGGSQVAVVSRYQDAYPISWLDGRDGISAEGKEVFLHQPRSQETGLRKQWSEGKSSCNRASRPRTNFWHVASCRHIHSGQGNARAPAKIKRVEESGGQRSDSPPEKRRRQFCTAGAGRWRATCARRCDAAYHEGQS